MNSNSGSNIARYGQSGNSQIAERQVGVKLTLEERKNCEKNFSQIFTLWDTQTGWHSGTLFCVNNGLSSRDKKVLIVHHLVAKCKLSIRAITSFAFPSQNLHLFSFEIN